MRRFTPAMAAYVVLILGVSAWMKHAPPTGPLLYAAAVLPALPLLAVIWAMGRYLIEETDEYQRAVQVQSVLWGTGATLAVSTVWGFLETYTKVPHLPAWYAFPVFCAAMGVAQCGRQLADRLGARG
jgi:cobalamin synthase